MACKGDSTPDRPHRLTWLLDVPDALEIVTREQLAQLAAMVPIAPTGASPRSTRTQSPFDLEEWLATHQVPAEDRGAWNGGRKWIFRRCPWNTEHTNSAAYLIQFANGAIAAGCHHNSCADKDWHALRDVVEPGWREGHTALPEAILSLIATVKEDRDPGSVFDAVDTLATLAAAQWGRVKAEIKDILGYKLNLNDLERAVNEARKTLGQGTPGLTDDGLPGIQVNDRPLRDISAEALRAVIQANTPLSVFVHGERLVRLRTTSEGRKVIEQFIEASLRWLLTRVANFLHISNDEIRHKYPPHEVAQDLLSFPSYPDVPRPGRTGRKPCGPTRWDHPGPARVRPDHPSHLRSLTGLCPPASPHNAKPCRGTTGGDMAADRAIP